MEIDFTKLKLRSAKILPNFTVEFNFDKLDENGKPLLQQHYMTIGPGEDVSSWPDSPRGIVEAARIGYTKPESE